MAFTDAQWQIGREAGEALLDSIGDDPAVLEVRLEESAFVPSIIVVVEVADGSAVLAGTWEEIGRVDSNLDDEVYDLQIVDRSTRWSGAYTEIPWRVQGGTPEEHDEEEAPKLQRIVQDPEDARVGRTRRFAAEVGAPVAPSGEEPPKLQKISEQAKGAERLVRVVAPVFKKKKPAPPPPPAPPKDEGVGAGPALAAAAFIAALAILASL